MKKDFLFVTILLLISFQAKGAEENLSLIEKFALTAEELHELKACEDVLRSDLEANLARQKEITQNLTQQLDQYDLQELVTFEEDGAEWFADDESLGPRVVLINNVYLGKLMDLQANFTNQARASGNLRLKSLADGELIKIPYPDVRSIKVFVSASSRKRTMDKFLSYFGDWPLAPYSEGSPDWMRQKVGFNYGHLTYGGSNGIFNSGNISQADPFASIRGKDLAMLFFDLETGQYSIKKLRLPQLLHMVQYNGQQIRILEIRVGPQIE